MAGGLAEKCCMEHCNLELYACCPHCLARLCNGCFGSAPCHTHNPRFPCKCRMCIQSFEADSTQLTPQPQTTPGVEHRRRRLRQKTKPQDCSPAYAIESPPSSKKGGWRKCEHPGCDQPLQTLLSLTGNKSGVAHVVQKDKRVCTLCQKRPWHQNLQIVLAEPVSVVEPSDSSKQNRLVDRTKAVDKNKWAHDTVDSLISEDQHTAKQLNAFIGRGGCLLVGHCACLISRRAKGQHALSMS